jgi:HemY protein
MRVIAWILALFGIAVGAALLAGNNQSTVTVFWPPYRVDLSLNLVLLLILGSFVVLHLALRGIAALFSMPQQARRWRLQQRERAMHAALLDALSHLLAGRFLRARKAAEASLQQEDALAAAGHKLPHAGKLRSMSHLVTAESAQALQDKATRDDHLKLALKDTAYREAQETREGIQLRAARWALADRDPAAAMQWLDELPQGAGRRTLALRARLKAARLAQQTVPALDTARLLVKHRAFSPDAALLILKGLALELINGAHDPSQLLRAWSQLEAAEQRMPDVAICAAHRLATLQGDVDQARQWLLPVWEEMARQPDMWVEGPQVVRLIRALEAGFLASAETLDMQWLERIEAAQQRYPRSANLQYLAGVACLHHQLWGKAHKLLSQAVTQLKDEGLKRSAWQALAALAEQRDDTPAAQDAYRRAAMS